MKMMTVMAMSTSKKRSLPVTLMRSLMQLAQKRKILKSGIWSTSWRDFGWCLIQWSILLIFLSQFLQYYDAYFYPRWKKLRKDLSMHERNLRVRQVTFVFSKASWLCFNVFWTCNLWHQPNHQNNFQPNWLHWGICVWKARWCNYWPCCSSPWQRESVSCNKGFPLGCGAWRGHVAPGPNVQTTSTLAAQSSACLDLEYYMVSCLPSKPKTYSDDNSCYVGVLQGKYYLGFCPMKMGSCCQVSPGKPNLPHMGRAMTDTQELRQVSCLPVLTVVLIRQMWVTPVFHH